MQQIESLDSGVVSRKTQVAPQPDVPKALRLAMIAGVLVLALIATGAAYIWFSGGRLTSGFLVVTDRRALP